MLYLNAISSNAVTVWMSTYLTLTSVVFELKEMSMVYMYIEYLTLTSVVFE